MRRELERLKADICQHASDTCWCGPAETVVDRIDWMLARLTPEPAAEQIVCCPGCTFPFKVPRAAQPPAAEPPAEDAIQAAMRAGSWFDRKDLTLHEREMQVARIILEFCAACVKAASPKPPGVERQLLQQISDCYFLNHNEGMLEIMRRIERYLRGHDCADWSLTGEGSCSKCGKPMYSTATKAVE